MITICANCVHYKAESDIWYGQYCTAKPVQHKKQLNFITGKTEYRDGPYPHARDINKDGQCPYFEKREGLLQLIPFLKLGD